MLLQNALSVVGDRWTLLVVREVALGVRRFDALHAATGAPRAVLADRLRLLVAANILEQRAYHLRGARPRQEYAMTAAGWDLLPVLAALSDWSQRHTGPDETPDVQYRHLRCGGRISARLVCACGEEISAQASHTTVVASVDRTSFTDRKESA